MNDPTTDDRLTHEDLTDAERAELTDTPDTPADAPVETVASTDNDDDETPDTAPRQADLIEAAREAARQELAAAREAQEAEARQQQQAEEAKKAERDFDAEEAALKAKYEDGEIDRDEFYDQRDAIRDAKRDFKTQQAVKQALQEREQAELQKQAEQAQAQWQQQYSEFINGQGNEALLNRSINAAFNETLKTLHAEKGLTGASLLAAAQQQLYKDINLPLPSAADATRKKADAVKDRRPTDTPPRDIASLPQAGNDAAKGSDEQLDALPINDLEDRLATMSPAQVERYLAGAPGGLNDYPRAVNS